MAFQSDCGLLLETRVQLVVFYSTIEAQVIFETLFTLVAGQFAIVSQLREDIHL